MGTKDKPSKFDCYREAAPDEPMFLLLARDKHAPEIVRIWAALREAEGEDEAKVEEARDCAEAMAKWRLPRKPKHTPSIFEVILRNARECVEAVQRLVENRLDEERNQHDRDSSPDGDGA